MGSNLLRLFTSALVGLAVAILAWAQESPAPGGLHPALWGMIVTLIKGGVDILVAKLGPPKSQDPATFAKTTRPPGSR
jgi:hypothetical protein